MRGKQVVGVTSTKTGYNLKTNILASEQSLPPNPYDQRQVPRHRTRIRHLLGRLIRGHCRHRICPRR